LPGAVPDQEPGGIGAVPGVHQEITGGLGGPGAVGAGGDAGQVRASGAVLDDDQGVDTPEQHGVDVHEVGGQDAAGLGGQELLPGRSGAPVRRADPGVVQDLPDRGGCDVMAEPHQLALDAAVTPARVICGDADHELADRGCRARPSGTPSAGVVPFPGGEAAMPGKQRRRGHAKHCAPLGARDQPG